MTSPTAMQSVALTNPRTKYSKDGLSRTEFPPRVHRFSPKYRAVMHRSIEIECPKDQAFPDHLFDDIANDEQLGALLKGAANRVLEIVGLQCHVQVRVTSE